MIKKQHAPAGMLASDLLWAGLWFCHRLTARTIHPGCSEGGKTIFTLAYKLFTFLLL